MKYRLLLHLDLEHSYYADGRCGDFVVEPSAETERLVKNHRGILKQTGSGIKLFVLVDENGTPFIQLSGDTRFVFHLRLVDASFPAFTDLSSLEQLTAPVFTNAAKRSGSFELTAVELKGDALSDPPDPHPKLPAGVFAMAEIRHRSSPGSLPPDPARYRIRFAAKSAHWSYYCVTDMASKSNDLTIVDLDNGKPDRGLLFGTANRTELGTKPDASDRVAAQLASSFPDLRLVRFISDRAVVCRDAPRKRLELQLNGERLVGPLPNPSWLDFTALPAANGERQGFYHVVTQLARPRTKNGG